MNQSPVDQFLQAVVDAQMASCQAFAQSADLDATVPNWRFGTHGAEAIRTELGRWYTDQGYFEEVRRSATSSASEPPGRLVVAYAAAGPSVAAAISGGLSCAVGFE